MALAPGPDAPRVVQTARWLRTPHSFLRECEARYGHVFRIRFVGAGDVVFVAEPECIKQMFTSDNELFRAGTGRRLLRPLLGKTSVLVLDGQRHLAKRKLLLPPFHGERMLGYGNEMLTVANDVIDRWSLGERFALAPSMQDITLQVILRTVFGIADATQLEHLHDPITRLVDSSSQSWRFFPSIFGIDPFVAAPWLEASQLKRTVDGALYAEIARRRREGSTRDDILSLLLGIRDEDGRGFSDEEIRDELITVLLAGHETTATGLAWTLGLLLRHPEHLARTRDELATVCADGVIDLAALTKLEWLDAVVREGLRIRPVVPQVSRTVSADATLAGYDVPKGTRVTASIYLTHHRADLYPHPERFDPSRFLGAKVDPYAWLPFGGGIRRCLGMAFALFELKVVLATVLLRTQLDHCAEDRMIPMRRSVTMAPRGGVLVTMRERRERLVPRVALTTSGIASVGH